MKAELIKKQTITGKDTLYIFRCPEIAEKALPGQFVEVKLSGEFFLRRPVSIFDCDGSETISLLVRSVGKGTEYMLSLEEGTVLDILGPLGKGFSLPTDPGKCLLVGGGIGLAPLYYLAKCLKKQGNEVQLFFSPRRDAQLLDAVERDLLPTVIAENRKDIADRLPHSIDGMQYVFSCGPEGLLEQTARECIKKDISCQVSMERRMGCGIDLCKGCVVAVYTENGLEYKKACCDGPVFDAKEVAFHEKP